MATLLRLVQLRRRRPTVEHNPLWAETLLWALQDSSHDAAPTLFDAQPAPRPPDACAEGAALRDLPRELAHLAGEYRTLDASSDGEPVFGQHCNVASRHRNECENYIYHLNDPPRWVVGQTPGIDRASLHALLPPEARMQVQRAREWMGWIGEPPQWREVPSVRVECFRSDTRRP